MGSAQHTKASNTGLYVLVILLFAISCAVRIALAWYPKGIGVLPDEIRYLDLASSLLNNGMLVERGGLASFQKILYPVALFPAYFFSDGQMREGAITILNCVYASSAIFPAFILARRVFADAKGPIIACLILTLILPDMCYSMTFLSESVYLPLALWLIVCCLVAFEKEGVSGKFWCLGAGLLCFLAYLAKEVALGFALAFITIMIVRIASDGEKRRGAVGSLVCFCVGLVLPFVIFKLTLFSGLLNSYNQADPSVLLNPYTVFFTFYAIIVDSMHFVMAFAFFPLIFPLLTWSRLRRKERELYLFCMLSFAFILLAVVYTISIREDLGHVGVRPHVRYVAPIFLPLLFLLIKQVMRRDGSVILKSRGRTAAACTLTAIMVLLVMFTFGSGDYTQGFDNAQYHVLRLAKETMEALPVDPNTDVSGSVSPGDIYSGSWLEIHPMIWLARFLACVYLIIGMWALMGRRRAKAGYFVIACITLFMLANNYGAWQYNSSVYKVDQVTVDETCAVEDFINALPEGEQVLIVYDDDTSARNNLMDVYIDNDALNCNYIKREDFVSVVNESGDPKKLLLKSDSTMGDNIYAVNGRTCKDELGISFVIVHSGQRLRLSAACAETATPGAVLGYTVYRLNEGASVSLV